MTWYYGGVPFEEDGTHFGFVYLIENLVTGRKYIGRKYFTAAGYRQIKGKRKKIRKESDWKSYFGSNETLKAEVAELGPDNFRRTILHLCKSKSECSYLELREQMDNRVLESDEFYNEWCQAKIRKAHLKSLVQHSKV